MNIVKQILTIIADSPTRRVPFSALKVKDLAFYLLLMENKGYLVNQEIDSDILDYEVYMTWEGYDFLETLNKEDKKTEKTESTAYYQKDMLEILNENIVKEIDKEEWNKVLNQTQYNFLVIEIIEDYGYMEEINYVQRFQSRLEAEAFIKDAKDKYKESLSDKMEYVKNYISNASQETINKFVKQFVFKDWNNNKLDYLIILLNQSESVVVEGYDPPKVANYLSNFYHILEIKEN